MKQNPLQISKIKFRPSRHYIWVGSYLVKLWPTLVIVSLNDPSSHIPQLLHMWISDNSLRTLTLQNEAASSDRQESSEEAELKRKKIEAQKVIVGREEM